MFALGQLLLFSNEDALGVMTSFESLNLAQKPMGGLMAHSLVNIIHAGGLSFCLVPLVQ